jgi:protocatechuate 4,5-dioxygenase alpha chain
MAEANQPIFGTTLFSGAQARKGYALNKMCYSFNHAENRAKFRADEEAYMKAYGLDEAQAKAIRERDVLGLIDAGGNVYYLAKFAGIFGLDMQDLGAAQTGLSKEEFKARLVEQNLQPETL